MTIPNMSCFDHGTFGDTWWWWHAVHGWVGLLIIFSVPMLLSSRRRGQEGTGRPWCPAEKRQVLSEFRPKVENEPDYSSLAATSAGNRNGCRGGPWYPKVTSLVKKMRAAGVWETARSDLEHRGMGRSNTKLLELEMKLIWGTPQRRDPWFQNSNISKTNRIRSFIIFARNQVTGRQRATFCAWSVEPIFSGVLPVLPIG